MCNLSEILTRVRRNTVWIWSLFPGHLLFWECQFGETADEKEFCFPIHPWSVNSSFWILRGDRPGPCLAPGFYHPQLKWTNWHSQQCFHFAGKKEFQRPEAPTLIPCFVSRHRRKHSISRRSGFFSLKLHTHTYRSVSFLPRGLLTKASLKDNLS